MALAEAEAVRKSQNSFLQIAAISDLLTFSTDPATSGIGLQSLSGLWRYDSNIFSPSLGPSWSRIHTCLKREGENLTRQSYIILDNPSCDALICAGVHPRLECSEIRAWITKFKSDFWLRPATFALILKASVFPSDVRQTATDGLIQGIIGFKFDRLRALVGEYIFYFREVFRTNPSSLNPEVEVIDYLSVVMELQLIKSPLISASGKT
jgi:hypothetical protein